MTDRETHIDRVDPPHWYAGMTEPVVQLMVYGRAIGSAEVTIASFEEAAEPSSDECLRASDECPKTSDECMKASDESPEASDESPEASAATSSKDVSHSGGVCIDRVVRTDSHLPTVMDFALFDRLNRAKSEETDAWELGLNRIYHTLVYDYLYADPSSVLAFLDNHDTERFLGNGHDTAALRQALAILLTIRRTPQLYYGTEILMNGTKWPDDGNVRRAVDNPAYNKEAQRHGVRSSPASLRLFVFIVFLSPLPSYGFRKSISRRSNISVL